MTIKSDKWLKENSWMVQPFHDSSINTNEFGEKIPSFGLSSYGYDVRLGRNFKMFKDQKIYDRIPTTGSIKVTRCYNPNGSFFYEVNKRFDGEKIVSDFKEMVFENYDKPFIDICKFDNDCLVEVNDVDSIILPPHSFVLGHSEERIQVPPDVSITCMGKSTIARAGIIVTVTPLEAAWEGFITLEITNTTGIPVKLETGIGITQLQFFQSDEQCEVSYADRGGKYQNQGKEPVAGMN